MLTLIGPILAQLVTVNVADRTEGRVIATDTTYYEAETYPSLSLALQERRLTLSAAYLPTLTISPLDRKPHQYLLFNTFNIGAAYAWRRTTLSIGGTLSYGRQNFRVLATSGGNVPLPSNTPTTPAGTTPPGGITPGAAGSTPVGGNTTTGSTPTTSTQPGATIPSRNNSLLFESYAAVANLTHQVTPALSWVASAGYLVTGPVHAADRGNFPSAEGPIASIQGRQQLDAANSVNASLSLQYTRLSDGIETWLSLASANYIHAFDVRTTVVLGAGISGGRNSRPDGYVAYSIFPTFIAGVSNTQRLHPGLLTFNLNASAAPALDFITLTVDPRLNFTGGATYTRDRFFVTTGVGTTYSISGEQTGAFSAVTGNVGTGYRLGKAVAVDAGMRVAYQRYEDRTALPFTYVGYVGLSFALSDRL